jgi:hypothetical protein
MQPSERVMKYMGKDHKSRFAVKGDSRPDEYDTVAVSAVLAVAVGQVSQSGQNATSFEIIGPGKLTARAPDQHSCCAEAY